MGVGYRHKLVKTGVLAVLLRTGSAVAQPVPVDAPAHSTTAAPQIVPPRAITALSVTYPTEAAERDLAALRQDPSTPLLPARVELQVLVSSDGSVTEAQALSGEEPFATAAVLQASSWRFAPATRNGQAVNAKIRVEVVFTPPILQAVDEHASGPSGSPPPQRQQSAPPVPEPAPSGSAVDVVVVGERTVGVKQLGRAEVRQMPGAFGDPYRAIEALPGVTPIVSGLPYFFIRGAPPGNVGYFFDGVSVPLLFHVAAGPGVIHPAFVENVNLYSGAYPIRYGRYSGGIVAGDAAEPEGRLRGEASLRLVDSGAFVEVPFADGKGSAMFAGRYSYTGLIISLLAKDVSLGYWDYQSKVSYKPDPETTVSLFAFGSHDFLAADNDQGERQEVLDLTFHRLNARYERELDAKTVLGAQLSFGFERTGIGGLDDGADGDDSDEAPGELSTTSMGARTTLDHRVSSALQLRSGIDVNVSRFDMRVDPDSAIDNGRTGARGVRPGPEGPSPDSGGNRGPRSVTLPAPGVPDIVRPSFLDSDQGEGDGDDTGSRAGFDRTFGFTRDDMVAGLWIEAISTPVPRVTFTPGLRFDVYDTGGKMNFTVEPRVAARFTLTDSLSVIHDFGLAHQPPSFAIPIPGLAGSPAAGMQQAIQSSAGLEAKLPAKLTGSATVFQNVILNSTDAFGISKLGTKQSEKNPFYDRTTNHSYGLELYVRRSLAAKLGGFLSYTLSRSTRSIPLVSGLSTFDRTHVINAAVAYDLGRRWRLGLRTLAYSGIPARVPYLAATKSPPRVPWFYRIDWRLEKRWVIGTEGAWWALVFEALNTTLNKEVLVSRCYAYGCKKEEIGPVTIPSVGVEASF